MPNVNVHPYQGSDLYCAQCQLPQQNQVHGTHVGHIMVTVGPVTWEWFAHSEDDAKAITVELSKRFGPPTLLGG